MQAEVRDQVRQLIKKLGMTPGTVAKKLAEFNCRGPKLGLRSCPLAAFLVKHDLLPPNHCVVSSGITHSENGVIVTDVIFPQQVRDFVEEFDHGRHWELTRRHQ